MMWGTRLPNESLEPMVVSDQPPENCGANGPGNDAFGWYTQCALGVLKKLCK